MRQLSTPLPGHPALSFAWNDKRSTARRHIETFLQLARLLGHDVEPLARLLDANAATVQAQLAAHAARLTQP